MGEIIALILIIPLLINPHVSQEVKIGLIILLIVIFIVCSIDWSNRNDRKG